MALNTKHFDFCTVFTLKRDFSVKAERKCYILCLFDEFLTHQCSLSPGLMSSLFSGLQSHHSSGPTHHLQDNFSEFDGIFLYSLQ